MRYQTTIKYGVLLSWYAKYQCYRLIQALEASKFGWVGGGTLTYVPPWECTVFCLHPKNKRLMTVETTFMVKHFLGPSPKQMEFYIFLLKLFSHLYVPLFLHPSFYLDSKQPLPILSLACSVTRNFSRKANAKSKCPGQGRFPAKSVAWFSKPNASLADTARVGSFCKSGSMTLQPLLLVLYLHTPWRSYLFFAKPFWGEPYSNNLQKHAKKWIPTGWTRYLLLKGRHCLGESVEICRVSYTTDALQLQLAADGRKVLLCKWPNSPIRWRHKP